MNRRPLSVLFVALLLPAVLVACGEEDAETPAANNSGANNSSANNSSANNSSVDPNALTYYRDVAPILDARCNTCHVQGGIAPFPLDDFSSVKALAPAAVAAMEAGTMPPWLPDPECRHFVNENVLAPGELDTFKQWMRDGMVEGDPSTFAPLGAPQPPPFEPTHVATSPSPYLPSMTASDDYRCFVLDTEFDAEMFLTASAVIPDAAALVHHVLVYAIGPDQLPLLEEADAAEEGPGYTCYGGPLPNSNSSGDITNTLGSGGLPNQLGSWVPGSAPQLLEEGTAIRIARGSRIVMQIHYNTLSSAPVPDNTAFQMRLTPEPPEQLATVRPLLIHDLEIPAGDPEAVNRQVFRNYGSKTLTIASVTPHMHQLGSRLKATIQRADGGEECVLDIKRWDFNWQQTALLAPTDYLQIAPGDAITLECVYDNSPGNQAVVDGQQLTPRDVTWGEGTLDEMCMLYSMRLEPYTPTPEGSQEDTCAEDGTACLAACAAEGGSSSTCFFNCELGTRCQLCALQSIIPCASSCIAPFQALRAHPCLESCFINTAINGGETGTCLLDSCPDEFAALAACLDPILDSGACDQRLEDSCGFEAPERP